MGKGRRERGVEMGRGGRGGGVGGGRGRTGSTRRSPAPPPSPSGPAAAAAAAAAALRRGCAGAPARPDCTTGLIAARIARAAHCSAYCACGEAASRPYSVRERFLPPAQGFPERCRAWPLFGVPALLTHGSTPPTPGPVVERDRWRRAAGGGPGAESSPRGFGLYRRGGLRGAWAGTGTRARGGTM